MEHRYQLGRPILLLLLLGIGMGLIWHIGHNIIPRQSASSLTKAAVKQETPRPTAPTGSSSDQAPPGQAVESKPIPPPQEPATSDKASSLEKTATPPTKPEKAAPQSPAAPEKTQAVQSPAQQASKTDESAAATVAGLNKDLPATLKELQSRIQNPRLLVNERGRFLTSEAILFNTGLAKLRPTSAPALDKLVTLLKEKPEIRLEILGYTDNFGVESANVTISTARAAAVKEYFVSQGVDSSRLESKGMGSRDPIASNDTQLGRQANRRIEFRITNPK